MDELLFLLEHNAQNLLNYADDLLVLEVLIITHFTDHVTKKYTYGTMKITNREQ